jgi:hypothetical protein
MAELFNLARMTTSTAGTGTITLGSAVSGYLSFADAGVTDGVTVSYGIRDGANSEAGTGVYASSGTTLTRSVTTSTNSNNAISLSGSAEVYITARAEDIIAALRDNSFTLAAGSDIEVAPLQLTASLGGDGTAYGGSTSGDANQWAARIVANVPATSSGASYEKMGLFISAKTSDPSATGPSINRDAVGIDSRGVIMAGNSTGRAWGGNFWGQIQATGDGHLVGVEIDIDNNGSDQSAFNTTTTKIGQQIVGISGTVAAGLYLTGAASTFHNGVFITQDVLTATGFFLRMQDASYTSNLFAVDLNGKIETDSHVLLTGTAVGDGSFAMNGPGTYYGTIRLSASDVWALGYSTDLSTYSTALTWNGSGNLSVTTDITVPNTGLHLLDTNASHDLIIAPGSDLTADHTLTLTTGDADRTVTLSGNPTLSDWFDQSVKTTANPQFATIELGAATDTTLTRVSAGVVAVEGNTLLTTATGQPLDATLTSIAALGTAADRVAYTTGVDTWAETPLTSFGRSIIDDADEATFKATVNLEIGTDVQAYDAGLADIAGLAVTDGNIIVGDGLNWVAESGATARTSLGLGTGDSPQFTAIELSHATANTLTASGGELSIEGAQLLKATTAASTYQPLDADLTSWAGVTRAAGFDTWVATPSSANLASLVTGETGSGALVFGTSPGFTTAANPVSDDGAALGTTALGWSDLFLASGGTVHFANTDWVATHTAGILTVGTGDLRVTTAGTNAASVVTVGGTQTLTSKTLTSPTIGTSPTAAGATWTDLGTVTTADINGGTIDGAVVGGASAAAGTFTTLAATTIELGAGATDTTLARSGAGDITIEGNAVYRAGGTDVALADGGTGASLADPNIDRVMGWDDSAGAVKFMALADINTEATPASGDYVLMYDAAGNLLKTDWVNLPGAAGGISNVVEDLTPQLGGDLDGNGFDIAFDDNTGIYDENGNEQLLFNTVASAVSYFELSNYATNVTLGPTVSGPSLTARSAETRAAISLITKDSQVNMVGRGQLLWNDGGTADSSLVSGISTTGDIGYWNWFAGADFDTGDQGLYYGYIAFTVDDVTGAAEYGGLDIYTKQNGSDVRALGLHQGLQVGAAPTGGDKGVGTINVSAGYYLNGANTLPKGHIWGLTMSNAADTANDITVAAGEAVSEDGTTKLVLAASITKQIDAAWAVGTNAGGINTGSVAAGWYEVHLIRRSDTGVVDVMFTTTANRATLPANYDQQRRIGWVKRNAGNTTLEQFTQIDDHFTWTTQFNDVSATATATAAAVTLTAPPSSIARFRATTTGSASVNTTNITVFSEIVEGDVTPDDTTGIGSIGAADVAAADGGHFELRVSSTSTIEHDSDGTTYTFDISTFGFIDHRRRLSAT